MELRSVCRNPLIWDFADHVNNVHTKTTDTLVNPKVHHVVDLLAQGRIFPVEVRLFLTKEVKIILL